MGISPGSDNVKYNYAITISCLYIKKMNIKVRDTVYTLTNDTANQSRSIRKRQNTYSASNYFEKMIPILEQKYTSAWWRNTLSLTYVILLTMIRFQKGVRRRTLDIRYANKLISSLIFNINPENLRQYVIQGDP